jgi:choline kinase
VPAGERLRQVLDELRRPPDFDELGMPALLNALVDHGESIEPLLNDHLQEHPMTARLVDSRRWIEIDTPQDYAEARRILESEPQPSLRP